MSVQNRRGQARRGEAIEASSSKGGVDLVQGKRDSVAGHLDRRRLRNPIHVGRPKVQSEESAVELWVGEIEREESLLVLVDGFAASPGLLEGENHIARPRMRAGLPKPPGYRFERHGAAVFEERHDREVEKCYGAEGAAPPHEFLDARNPERLQAIAVSI
jgi:hypothetical protein